MSGNAPSYANHEVAALHLKQVTFGYGSTPTVHDCGLTVNRGQFLTLIGPSGCGKTTLLKLIGGYLLPAAGQILLSGIDCTHVGADKRRIGMVFQNYALFPHLTAFRNIAFGLEVAGAHRKVIQQHVETLLTMVGLTKEEATSYPAKLSGGQQQRVALARALAISPAVLLLDEPMANLDKNLRIHLRQELRQLQIQTGVATVMVTHDQEEALAISDLVGVMNHGRILQIGPPEVVYSQPSSEFVAKFLGLANILPSEMVQLPPGKNVMVRPEWLQLGSPQHGGLHWTGNVMQKQFCGQDHLLTIQCGQKLQLLVRSQQAIPQLGEEVSVNLASNRYWVLPTEK
ncbi:MAG: ABC transporter ATP-binding protein [Zavarzinella sp.]